MEGDQILKQLRWRLRRHAAIMVFGGTVMVTLCALWSGGSDWSAVGFLAGFGIAVVGLWRLVRLPVYLRRPDEIMRIDLHAPGDRYQMQIVMENGRVCRLAVGAEEREPLKTALEHRIGEVRLRARVVRR